MPYVITTTTRGPKEPGIDWSNLTSSSRVAVASLDEARDRAHHEVTVNKAGSTKSDLHTKDWHTLEVEAQTFEWYEGAEDSNQPITIGPLPDGTLIEVERVDDSTLIRRSAALRATPLRALPETTAEIVAAFNNA
jgi:hypothetical protein